MKAGMQVVCVDATKQSRLKLGSTYTVALVDGHRLFVEGYARYSFLNTRFKELV